MLQGLSCKTDIGHELACGPNQKSISFLLLMQKPGYKCTYPPNTRGHAVSIGFKPGQMAQRCWSNFPHALPPCNHRCVKQLRTTQTLRSFALRTLSRVVMPDIIHGPAKDTTTCFRYACLEVGAHALLPCRCGIWHAVGPLITILPEHHVSLGGSHHIVSWSHCANGRPPSAWTSRWLRLSI